MHIDEVINGILTVYVLYRVNTNPSVNALTSQARFTLSTCVDDTHYLCVPKLTTKKTGIMFVFIASFLKSLIALSALGRNETYFYPQSSSCTLVYSLVHTLFPSPTIICKSACKSVNKDRSMKSNETHKSPSKACYCYF